MLENDFPHVIPVSPETESSFAWDLLSGVGKEYLLTLVRTILRGKVR
jgi:hypothetical protein